MDYLRIHYLSDTHATREPYYDVPFAERSNKLAVTVPQDPVGGSVYLMQQILTSGGSQAHYLGLFQLLRQYIARSQMASELLLKPVTQICLYSLARLGCLEFFNGKTADGISRDPLDILARDDCAEARILCFQILQDLSASPHFIERAIGYRDSGATWLDMGTLTESYNQYTPYMQKTDKALFLLLSGMMTAAWKATYNAEDLLSEEVYSYINANTENIYQIGTFNPEYVYTPQQCMDILVSFVLDPFIEGSRVAMRLLSSLLAFHGDDFLRVLLHCNSCNKLINAMYYILGTHASNDETTSIAILADWGLSPTSVYLMQRAYFENYCSIVTGMAHHLSTLSNATESGLLATAIVMCHFSSTFKPAIALLDAILLTDYSMASTVYKNTLAYIYLDDGHSFIYSVLVKATEVLCNEAKRDAVNFALSLMKYKECVQDFNRDLRKLFVLVAQKRFTTLETAHLFSAAAQYAQNQRVIGEFLNGKYGDELVCEAAHEIENLMIVTTSARLQPVEQMGYKFQELDLGWKRPE